MYVYFFIHSLHFTLAFRVGFLVIVNIITWHSSLPTVHHPLFFAIFQGICMCSSKGETKSQLVWWGIKLFLPLRVGGSSVGP